MSDNNGSVDTGNPATIVPPANDAPWYASIENPDLKGFAELKGFKDPAAVLDSYRNLETKLGAPPDRLVKLPEKPDDPAWSEVFSKVGLGRPAEAKEYGLQVPEGVDPGYARAMEQAAFDAGVPKKHLAALVEANAKFAAAEDARVKALEEVKSAQDIAALKQSWGGLYEQNVELGRRAAAEMAAAVGLEAPELSEIEGAIGTAKFLKLFAAVGSKNNQEAAFREGGPGNTSFGMSPEAANVRFNELMLNPEWVKKALTPGTAENAEKTKLSHIKAGYKPQ